jgi:signal peptidase II
VGGALDGWRRMVAVAGIVAGLDQIAKAVASSALVRGERVELILGLRLTNVRNSGIAFGLFDKGEGAVVLVTALALALVLLYFSLNASMAGLWLPVGMLVGGALGNLADRVREDSVADFLDPPLWPAFNLADIAIVLGVVLFAYQLSRGKA